MPVYLDHNATTPLDGRVAAAMEPYLKGVYGNPSSVHRFGRLVRGAIDQAREQVAALVKVQPSQVIFTGGGTEANNFALKGAAAKLARGRLSVSAVEHASLLGPAEALAAQGWQLDFIPVDEQCRVAPDVVRACLHRDTRLVSVMMVNNETGAIQDIAAVADTVRAAGAVLHTDAVQAAGKVPIDFGACGAHMMSLSSHKIYGPQGVGALVVDKSLEIEPLLHGGGQERNLRGGTENVAGIVGFGAAAELAAAELEQRRAHMLELRRCLEDFLRRLSGVVIFADRAERVPNTVQIGMPGIDGETLLMALDRRGIAVSSGSACASGKKEPSHVLTAMGVEQELARSAIRISLGKDSARSEIDFFCKAFADVAQGLQGAAAGMIGRAG